MPTTKLQVKRETSLVKLREGRLKAAELPGRGRPRHVTGAALAGNLCGSQQRRVKLPPVRVRER